MRIYVDINAERDGDGSESRPFRHIDDAARVAMPGDEVLVAPGIYREYVNPATRAPRTRASPTAASNRWAR